MLEHDGSFMPVSPDQVVTVLQRNGEQDEGKASEFGWKHRLDHNGKPWGGDIIAYVEARV
jgi:hypothetical protein